MTCEIDREQLLAAEKTEKPRRPLDDARVTAESALTSDTTRWPDKLKGSVVGALNRSYTVSAAGPSFLTTEGLSCEKKTAASKSPVTMRKIFNRN